VIRRSLELRRRGDQLGAVSERDLFYWLRAHVQAGDVRRGKRAKIASWRAILSRRQHADAAWEEAERHYRAADEIASLVGAAVQTRDQAYAELPYLAQWFFRPAATEPAGPQAENRKRVITLVEQVQQLSAELDRHGTTEGESAFDQPGFAAWPSRSPTSWAAAGFGRRSRQPVGNKPTSQRGGGTGSRKSAQLAILPRPSEAACGTVWRRSLRPWKHRLRRPFPAAHRLAKPNRRTAAARLLQFRQLKDSPS